MENIHFHRRYTNSQEVYGKCSASLISVKCKLYPSEIASHIKIIIVIMKIKKLVDKNKEKYWLVHSG